MNNSSLDKFNPQLSVDCVVFGFDGESLKVLLIEREAATSNSGLLRKSKLPGDLIFEMEDLDSAAERVLQKLTGLTNLFLRQFAVFGSPDRMKNKDDKQWLEESSGLEIRRVVTTAYYALIRINNADSEKALSHGARWQDIKKLPELAFDHKEIIIKGLESIKMAIRFEPICFNLLPKKFTIRQLQTLYEVILDQKFDNRNFRKKALKANYIEPSNEKQSGVAHKPAMYYIFNEAAFLESQKDYLYYHF
ncbi:MAG TPA: NUDIX domain-containing protein [Bacteroidales bacterium]|nr:NUDIX domain-containing protein [Bacteroidales bacterium]